MRVKIAFKTAVKDEPRASSQALALRRRMHSCSPTENHAAQADAAVAVAAVLWFRRIPTRRKSHVYDDHHGSGFSRQM